MTPNKLSLSLAAAVLAGFAFVPRASATVSVAATFDEKVEKADAIVLGRVVRQESRLDESRGMILTYTTLQIEKTLKGGAPKEVTIVTPGGKVGDLQQTTIGVPSFERGSENVVFVRNTKSGPTVLFFDQGAYDVVSERGEKVVRPVASDAVHIDEQRGMAVAREHPRALRDFESAVRTSVARARQNRMDVLERQRQKLESQTSITALLAENKWLIFAAALGIALAAIQFIRRH
ncbi:MAG TPA: hypothetical protein VF057_11835 [Thermoanaerobaculia bacterium]